LQLLVHWIEPTAHFSFLTSFLIGWRNAVPHINELGYLKC